MLVIVVLGVYSCNALNFSFYIFISVVLKDQ